MAVAVLRERQPYTIGQDDEVIPHVTKAHEFIPVWMHVSETYTRSAPYWKTKMTYAVGRIFSKFFSVALLNMYYFIVMVMPSWNLPMYQYKTNTWVYFCRMNTYNWNHTAFARLVK